MKIKCEYCKSYINDYDERCPNCGGINEHLVRKAEDSPKTIEELKQWYINRNLPPENVTRFFIGTNYKKPKAFGIYKDEKTGNFVVYKNKDTGQRAIRYEGKDEAYAVNELYLRLKEEIINQKTRDLNKKILEEYVEDDSYIDQNAMMRRLQQRDYEATVRKNVYKKLKIGLVKATVIYLIIIFVILLMTHIADRNYHERGYYYYDGSYYYYQRGDWYIYGNSWRRVLSVPYELKENAEDYYSSSYYSLGYDVSDFSDSSYYSSSSHHGSSSSSYSGDWDSGSSWSSGSSWDSSGTDWSSDW